MVPVLLVDLAAEEMLKMACSHCAPGFETALHLGTQGNTVMEVVAYQVIQADLCLAVMVFCLLVI